MTEPVNPPSPATVPAYPQLGSPTFNAEAYAYGTAMPGVVANINEMGQAAYTNATSAKEKALAAAGSANTASTKATEAAESAALAGTKSTQAALSANAAADSATEAESAAIASTKLNLGDKVSEPAVDNQGEPLRYGATYYNTTTNKWRVYTPFGWDDGLSAPGVFVSKSGDKLNGALDWATPADLASAATTQLGSGASNRLRITGTTAITSFGAAAAGVCRTVTFAGALTLTHNATSLILPGGANITTAAGDVAEFESLGSGNWRCTSYLKANGQAVVSPTMPTLQSLNRGAYVAVSTSGGTLVPNTRYGVRTGGGAITMTMPSFANSTPGDEIVFGQVDASWGVNAFTVNFPANVIFKNASGVADNTLVCNTANPQGFKLYCAWKDGTNAYWVLA